MEFAGYVAEDAPDPRSRTVARIAALDVPVAGLVPQPHLEDRFELGIASSARTDPGGRTVLLDATFSRTYLLWRNPHDRADPVNLRELDPASRAALAEPPARPLPAWLHEARELLRHPQLWEAVQTHWTAPEEERRPLAELLVQHAEYILTNRFREELGLGPEGWAPSISTAALQPAEVTVDEEPRPGLLLDTDPFVLGLGTALDDGRMLTVVVERDALPLLRLELASDLPLTPTAS